MMSERMEGLCFGVSAALIALVVLNICGKAGILLPEVDGSAASAEATLSTSPSGFSAETLIFAMQDGETMTVVRNRNGAPVARIDGSAVVGWSPRDDILMVRAVEGENGFRLLDIRHHDGYGKPMRMSKAFGSDDASAAIFTPDGMRVCLRGTDGSLKALDVATLLKGKAPLGALAALDTGNR